MRSLEKLPEETQRQALLETYGLLESGSEAAFDELTQLAVELFEVPLCRLSFVTAGRVWHKALAGQLLNPLPLEQSFCLQVLQQGEWLTIPDSRAEDTADLPEGQSVVCYAGTPLLTPEGLALGVLWIADICPRLFSAGEARALNRLAAQGMHLLTQRRQQFALKERLERYAAALDSAQVGLWELWDQQPEKNWFSPLLYQQLGYQVDEIDSSLEGLFSLIHPEDVPIVVAGMAQIPAQGEVLQNRVRLRAADQSYRWFATRGQTFRDGNGKVLRRVGTLVDVDQQVRAELARERFFTYLNRLQQIPVDLELSPDDFLRAGLQVLCDYYGFAHGGISRVQGGIYELMAVFDRDTALGPAHLHPGQKFALGESLVQVLYDREEVGTLEDIRAVYPARYQLLKSYGIETLIGTCFSIQGEPYGVVCCYDARLRSQGFSPEETEFMQEFSRWLDIRLERRFYIEHLQKLNTSKDRLLAVVAHDLRNPLAAILSAKNHLNKNLASGKPLDFRMLTVIDHAYTHAMQLISELLEAGELEQQLKLPLEPMNLYDFVQAVYNQFEAQATSRQIKLCWQPEVTQARVALNPRKLIRVLENLLNNALKFTPAGGEIRLRLQQQGQEAWLSIEDTGIGIPPELQTVLFDKYSAARRQGLQGEASNGLGMYIVQEIVHQHGGRIRVSSVVNQGTCFRIELPLVQELASVTDSETG